MATWALGPGMVFTPTSQWQPPGAYIYREKKPRLKSIKTVPKIVKKVDNLHQGMDTITIYVAEDPESYLGILIWGSQLQPPTIQVLISHILRPEIKFKIQLTKLL